MSPTKFYSRRAKVSQVGSSGTEVQQENNNWVPQTPVKATPQRPSCIDDVDRKLKSNHSGFCFLSRISQEDSCGRTFLSDDKDVFLKPDDSLQADRMDWDPEEKHSLSAYSSGLKLNIDLNKSEGDCKDEENDARVSVVTYCQSQKTTSTEQLQRKEPVSDAISTPSPKEKLLKRPSAGGTNANKRPRKRRKTKSHRPRILVDGRSGLKPKTRPVKLKSATSKSRLEKKQNGKFVRKASSESRNSQQISMDECQVEMNVNSSVTLIMNGGMPIITTENDLNHEFGITNEAGINLTQQILEPATPIHASLVYPSRGTKELKTYFRRAKRNVESKTYKNVESAGVNSESGMQSTKQPSEYRNVTEQLTLNYHNFCFSDKLKWGTCGMRYVGEFCKYPCIKNKVSQATDPSWESHRVYKVNIHLANKKIRLNFPNRSKRRRSNRKPRLNLFRNSEVFFSVSQVKNKTSKVYARKGKLSLLTASSVCNHVPDISSKQMQKQIDDYKCNGSRNDQVAPLEQEASHERRRMGDFFTGCLELVAEMERTKELVTGKGNQSHLTNRQESSHEVIVASSGQQTSHEIKGDMDSVTFPLEKVLIGEDHPFQMTTELGKESKGKAVMPNFVHKELYLDQAHPLYDKHGFFDLTHEAEAEKNERNVDGSCITNLLGLSKLGGSCHSLLIHGVEAQNYSRNLKDSSSNIGRYHINPELQGCKGKQKLQKQDKSKRTVKQRGAKKAPDAKFLLDRGKVPTVDDITRAAELLNIRDDSMSSALVQYADPCKNALVPYKDLKKKDLKVGLDSSKKAIVPYKALTKKFVKVDLDSETWKMWDQLLRIEDGAHEEKLEEDQEKYWEAERKIFQGRIDSFTSRMHLILGDRRFKEWKGSVVDSVVGVYLTQNVSDNLSSSAYMSLRAKYPFHTRNNEEACCEDQEMMESQGSTGPDIKAHDPPGSRYFVTEPESDYSMLLQKSDVHRPTTLSSKRTEDTFSIAIVHDTGFNKDSRADTILGDILSGESHTMISYECNSPSTSRLHHDGMAETQNNTLESTCNAITATIEGQRGENPCLNGESTLSDMVFDEIRHSAPRGKKITVKTSELVKRDWHSLTRVYSRPRKGNQMDTIDWEAVRHAELDEVADTIKARGQQTIIGARIQDFLNREVRLHGSIDLEWLRYAPPGDVKKYLLEIQGLGLKSVECVRLLALQHIAFPVDINVGRIAVRLGWIPLTPLPGDLQFHLLDEYPLMDSIQMYLWPRLCKLDQRTLYELHYHMITFGKVFCTKRNPNCNVCPLRGECKHFASRVASVNLCLPGPSDKGVASSTVRSTISHLTDGNYDPTEVYSAVDNSISVSFLDSNSTPDSEPDHRNCQPFVEEPKSPHLDCDMEDMFKYQDISDCGGDEEEIPTITLNEAQFNTNFRTFWDQYSINCRERDLSTALVPLSVQAASIPAPKLKNVTRLRTEHRVYELPDNHVLLRGLPEREPDDPGCYLLAIWTAGEKADSYKPPERRCNIQGSELCDDETCFTCQAIREKRDDTVRGTILIPCRTAMRGSFPLNGTYFQVNEVFADHETSYRPLTVQREWIWHLPMRTVFFGTSTSSIFRGLSLREIQLNFWRGYVCIRGFERATGAPRPLTNRFHCLASKIGKSKR